MICSRGCDQALECDTDVGMSLEISDMSSHAGMLEAKIKFDLEKFVQYYVPTADIFYDGSTDHIPHEILKSLLDAEVSIGARRQNRYFL